MSLDTIMNLQISVESRAPTQEGFGTPLLFGYHTAWIDDLVREYATADDMLDDGFTADHYLYKAARILKSQNPSPATFKIGRRVAALTQVITITPTITTTGFRYKGTIGGKSLNYAVPSSSTLTSIGAAIASAISTLAVGTTAASVAGVITCTAGATGTVIDFDLGDGMKIQDDTADSTTDAELANIADQDFDWYGLAIPDSCSKATALRAASYIESVRKICIVQTPDTACLDNNVDDDVMSELVDSSYSRTHAVYHRQIGGVEWLAVGWQSGYLTTTPGSATTAFKTVAGVKTDKLLQAQENAILKKHGSDYTFIGGLALTFEGKAGDGSFIDTVRFIDWVYARMRERVLGVLANNPKIPYTDAGVDIMRGAIMAVIKQGISAQGFAATPVPTVSAPLVKDVDPANRINRILPDINWTANLAGAIHRLNPVKGVVSV